MELDRFYDTFMLLKDYYTGMEGMHGMYGMQEMYDCVCLVVAIDSCVTDSRHPMSNLPQRKFQQSCQIPCSRLPLVELAPTEAQEISGSAASSTHNILLREVQWQKNGETDTRKEQTAESKVSKDGSK